MGLYLQRKTGKKIMIFIVFSILFAQLFAGAHAAWEFAEYAHELSEVGIIGKQVTEADFRLSDNITRAEMAKIAVQLSGKDAVTCTGKVFSDVSVRIRDLCGYVESAANAGLVSKSVRFRPNDPVTRAEMVKMMLRATNTQPSDTAAGFTDVPASLGDLQKYVNAWALTGCIKHATKFRPNDTSTRWESFKVAACIAWLVKSSTMFTPTAHDSNFSPKTLAFLQENTWLDGEQWDNIMKLVNKPEQDSLEWTAAYGYCEDIGDDRWYTIGIFWATTGGPNDMWPDAPKLFRNFDATSGSGEPTTEGGLARINARGTMDGRVLKISDSPADFCTKVNGLQNNEAWREAIWRTFYEVYISESMDQAKKLGFTDALTIGSFVDTALNQGGPSLDSIISKSWNSKDEKIFLANFYAERTKVVDTNRYNQAPNGASRVKQWSDLMRMGKFDLKDIDTEIISVTGWEMR
jgi:chitosanase